MSFTPFSTEQRKGKGKGQLMRRSLFLSKLLSGTIVVFPLSFFRRKTCADSYVFIRKRKEEGATVSSARRDYHKLYEENRG
jgi:hypothetical protein